MVAAFLASDGRIIFTLSLLAIVVIFSVAMLSSDCSVQGPASKAAQSVFASSDDVIELHSFKAAATPRKLMGMSLIRLEVLILTLANKMLKKSSKISCLRLLRRVRKSFLY